MRFRYRAGTWASFATCLGLCWISGCGGDTPVAPAPAAPAASAPGAGAASMPSEPESGAGQASNIADGSGAVLPGGEGSAGPDAGILGGGGMPAAGMPGSGASAGMSFESPGAMPGMEGSGMPGMGMPGMGMPGMGAPGMGMPGMGMPGMSMGGPGFDDPAPAEDADYLSKAKYAFAIGKESVAEQYVIAEILANEASAPGLLQQVRFAVGPRKPTFALRFGVGVNLEAPTSITDLKPIGRTQFAGANGQGGGGGGSEAMAGGMPGGSGQQGGGGGAQKTLGDLTGRFGDEFIKSFEGAWDAGTFGPLFADVETIVPRRGIGNQNNRGMDMGSAGMPGMMPGMGMAGMSSEGMPGSGSGSPGNGAPPSEALRLRATAGKAVVPGLTFLGTGKETELLGKAEAEGLDYLFYYEVEVKAQRGLVVNDTRLRLISVKDKKNLGATSTLNNNRVDKEMAMKGDSDEVAKQLTNLFRKVDTIKPIEMPKLSPEAAQARVKSLIEKKTKDVLPILMEIKLYHSQGSLNDEERDAAFQLTLPNGLAFVNGTPEDREFVLGPLLPGYK